MEEFIFAVTDKWIKLQSIYVLLNKCTDFNLEMLKIILF